jgi:hypothetical protein
MDLTGPPFQGNHQVSAGPVLSAAVIVHLLNGRIERELGSGIIPGQSLAVLLSVGVNAN